MELNDFEEIFITGGNGWLGQQLIYTLLFGDNQVIEDLKPYGGRIHCLINPKDNYPSLKIKQARVNLFHGDLRKDPDIKEFLRECKGSLIIHTAGIIHPKNIKDFNDINFNGTRRLIEQGIKNGAKKFIVISSNSPLGCNRKGEVFDEKSPYNPYMKYGESKMLMELYLKEKINQGVDITIIRVPWFHGKFMPERQLSFYRLIRNGLVPVIGNGENIRSMANVKNITQGILLSATSINSKGKIYWISDRQSYTYNEIVNTIRNVLRNEYKIQVKTGTIKLPFIIGQLFELIDFCLQSIGVYIQGVHVLSELNKNIEGSIELAISDLGYDPQVSLYEGINESLKNIDLRKSKLS